jgi:hypothetical protein
VRAEELERLAVRGARTMRLPLDPGLAASLPMPVRLALEGLVVGAEERVYGEGLAWDAPGMKAPRKLDEP